MITVENMSPQTITVASGRCTSDPIPVAIDAGNNPKAATVAVINTGRNLSFAPNCTAVRKSNFFLKSLMCDIIITPFCMATPKSAINPTAEDTFRVMLRMFNAIIPPNKANGTIDISKAACLNFPKAPYKSKNMKARVIGITTPNLA